MPKGLASQLRRSERISLLWHPQNLAAESWLLCRLCAECAAPGVDRDFAQTLFALFGCGISRHGSFTRPRYQSVDGGHDEKVHRGCD